MNHPISDEELQQVLEYLVNTTSPRPLGIGTAIVGILAQVRERDMPRENTELAKGAKPKLEAEPKKG